MIQSLFLNNFYWAFTITQIRLVYMHKKTDHEDRALRLNLKFKLLTFLIYKKRCKAVTHQHNKKLCFLRRSWLYFSSILLNATVCYCGEYPLIIRL